MNSSSRLTVPGGGMIVEKKISLSMVVVDTRGSVVETNGGAVDTIIGREVYMKMFAVDVRGVDIMAGTCKRAGGAVGTNVNSVTDLDTDTAYSDTDRVEGADSILAVITGPTFHEILG